MRLVSASGWGGFRIHITVDGLVLRRHATGQDFILTILTAEQGVLTAFLKGTSAQRGKPMASAEVLCYSRFVLFKGRSGNIVDKADTNRIFFGIWQDLDKLCLGSYFAQLAAELCPQGEQAAEPLRLILNTLHYLEKNLRDPRQLKVLFELRLLTLTGFMPNLVGCRSCARFEVPAMFFFPEHGELCCGDCAGEVSPPGGARVSAGVLAAMRHILYSDGEKLYSFILGGEGLDALCILSERYLLSQVEKSFSALELYNSCRVAPLWEPPAQQNEMDA